MSRRLRALCLRFVFVLFRVLYASLLGVSISLLFPHAVFFFFFLCFCFFFPGRIVRAKRIVEAANAKEYEYMEGSIPMEWDGKSGQ